MTLKSKDVRRRARQELSQFAARVIDADTVEHSAVFESDGVRKTLFFRFGDSAHAMAGREPVIEAFVIALLTPAMRTGGRLIVHGRLEHDFLFDLNTRLIPLLCAIHPHLQRIEIECPVGHTPPAACTAAEVAPRLTLLGMSCGLDALTAYLEHSRLPADSRLKVDGFLFNDVGAFGRGHDKFVHDLEQVRAFASRIGLPLFVVASNIAEFQDGKYTHTFSLRNAASAWSLRPLAEAVIFASSYSFDALLRADPQENISIHDMKIFPLLSSADFLLYSSGGQHPRSAKQALLVEDGGLIEDLNVCLNATARKHGYTNCGSCRKCQELLLRAEACGQLERFDKTFHLAAYRKVRSFAIFKLAYNSVAHSSSRRRTQALPFLEDGRFPQLPRLLGLTAGRLTRLYRALVRRPG